MKLHAHCQTLAILVTLFTSSLVTAQTVRTDRDPERKLALPNGEEMFQFVIFGDRTGGPASGLKILSQAVEDTNLLDPDLVMTVGDLINGYNQTAPWLEQMKNYRAIMDGLRMPWFPVAGNHDIYWRRDAKKPEPKPKDEHQTRYEKHFGPLWYWFEHKKCGFLVLFTDEGHPDGRARSFTDPEQQKISDRQLEWIEKALGEMKDLRHVFVFLHHPFWWRDRYPGNNWGAVHERLAKPGNVRAVFAGHIHRMRYDGKRDGIEYYALAVTGGSIRKELTHAHFGILHHFNVVTVRPKDYSVASVPVGTTFDPRQFTPERLAETDAARYLRPEIDSAPVVVRPQGSAAAICVARVTNPLKSPIEASLTIESDESWSIAPDHHHAQIAPGETRRFSFAVARTKTGNLEGFEPPKVQLSFDILTSRARIVMPVRHRPLELKLELPESKKPTEKSDDKSDQKSTESCLLFDGKSSSVRIRGDALRDKEGPFTVEAWVRPEGDASGGVASNQRIGGWSLEVAGTPRFVVQTDPASLDYRDAGRLRAPIVAAAKKALRPGCWHHLAGVFDGKAIHLWVDGERVASARTGSARLGSDKDVLIGARVEDGFHVFNETFATSPWSGAIDEVRISRGARYGERFSPQRKLPADSGSLVVIDGDSRLGPFLPARGPAATHAFVRGNVRIAARPE